MPQKNISLHLSSTERFLAALATASWKTNARPAQQTPEGEWRIWLILAGRGWGKTRTGAEDAAAYALWHAGSRVAVVAPTYADARDTCVEGDSGLLAVIPRHCIEAWNRSQGELILKNGSRFKLFSADEPERLRGPQHHRAWCDELAAWTQAEAFDQVLFGLRLGDDPRVVVTTTPKPTELVTNLLKRDDVHITRGSTFDNAANLAPSALATLKERYEGTRLGRQELYAEVLTDVQGALWARDMLDKQRVSPCPELDLIVVALDPAVSTGPNADETGIIVAGRDKTGHIYVLADASGVYSPDGWAQRAATLAEHFGAAYVVGEVNEGGDLLARVMRTAAPDLRFKPVRAVKGKLARAVPVAALYEQGRVHHVGSLAGLEDQMCRFTLSGYSPGSPDRVDALVWAVTELAETVRAQPGLRML